VKKYRERAAKGKNVTACQIQLAQALKTLLRQMKKDFPGVWRATAIDDLEVIAEELPLMAEKKIDTRILMWWQPTLPEPLPPEMNAKVDDGWYDTDNVFHPFAYEGDFDSHICRRCQVRRVPHGNDLCDACLGEIAPPWDSLK